MECACFCIWLQYVCNTPNELFYVAPDFKKKYILINIYWVILFPHDVIINNEHTDEFWSDSKGLILQHGWAACDEYCFYIQYFSKPGDTFLSGRRLVWPRLALPCHALSCLVLSCLGLNVTLFRQIQKWDSYGGVALMRFYFIYKLINHGW